MVDLIVFISILSRFYRPRERPRFLALTYPTARLTVYATVCMIAAETMVHEMTSTLSVRRLVGGHDHAQRIRERDNRKG